MSRTHVHKVHVEFGDCDPAGIVWFPNFFRWVDAASRHFFRACGVPPWAQTAKTHGIIGTPLVDTRASFLRTASYDDDIEVHSSITAWGNKSFEQTHRVMRGDLLLAEIVEKRVFASRHPSDPRQISAVPAPPEFRALCE
ncbi:MAG: acyl-CoA thioesterase [Quisquiliibacterium sp.]